MSRAVLDGHPRDVAIHAGIHDEDRLETVKRDLVRHRPDSSAGDLLGPQQ